ncbi:glucuronate isomerase [Rhodoferax sp. AJA081-3]|uniref:glucuronate isomerase n=1 Tax=Rhodoferax sp. AJA081-3 TaxID=2752316 RepID=UPI001AE01AFF|nr:glucuronate isomerase [Rhodoferax sp. AJA081-3]QTN26320.1 glucuronate isomerase [Rhodoferax sp. AJA081-3]
MPSFMDPHFLLDTETAQQLYHDVAAELPIIDYHSHLQQGEIAAKKQFRNIAELWLAGDHYKWRLMRSAGVSEDFVTGPQSDEAKFLAFCRVLPLAAGNPIYHWCHLELRRIFGITLTINATNAPRIWEQANTRLATMTCWTLLEQAKVEVACTTDDPVDDLAQHESIARSGLSTRVLPAFRPDAAMRINRPGFADYLVTLGAKTGSPITRYADLVAALADRVAYFHQRGARISDHAIDLPISSDTVSVDACEVLLSRRLSGATLSDAEQAAFQRGLLQDLGTIYARHQWAMCLHIGAQRNNSQRGMQVLGPDTGYDAISDAGHSRGIAGLLDALDADGLLPKTILFCLNPAMNEMLAALIGCFQDGSVAGKVQMGPAWWFNDHKDGNLRQLRALANHGVLGSFVGMVTDSRSFASYPRHDYFRRLLCRQLGRWVQDGEYPDDQQALETLVRGVCYDNAKRYFAL